MRNILRIKINKKTFEDAWALGKLIFFTILYTKQIKSAAACIICYKGVKSLTENCTFYY